MSGRPIRHGGITCTGPACLPLSSAKKHAVRYVRFGSVCRAIRRRFVANNDIQWSFFVGERWPGICNSLGDDQVRQELEIGSCEFLRRLIGWNERLGIEIPQNDRGHLTTFNELVAYIAN